MPPLSLFSIEHTAIQSNITFLIFVIFDITGISCQSFINNIENMVIQFSVGWLPLWAD